ncbi:hypothetical protein TRVL_06781 [Trypanosoma vivax]|nr:hypothetical protein TRVL_06781 [Trypanosoma vivax]
MCCPFPPWQQVCVYGCGFMPANGCTRISLMALGNVNAHVKHVAARGVCDGSLWFISGAHWKPSYSGIWRELVAGDGTDSEREKAMRWCVQGVVCHSSGW